VSEKSERYRFQLFKFFLYHMFIPISAVLFFYRDCFLALLVLVLVLRLLVLVLELWS